MRRFSWITDKFTLGTLVDAIGAGMFLPFTLLFFTEARGISLPIVSLGLSVGAAVTLACTYPLGALVDALGPKRILIITNLGRAAVFVLFAFLDNLFAIVVLLAVNALLERGSWISLYAVIGRSHRLFGGTGALRFARLAWIRNVGIGVGALSAAVLATSISLMFIAVWAKALGYLVATVCFMFSKLEDPSHNVKTESAFQKIPSNTKSYGRSFWLVVSTKFFLVMIATIFSSFLPVAVDTHLVLAWLAGVALAINSWMIVIAQPWIINYIQRFDPVRNLLVGTCIYLTSSAIFIVALVIQGWLSAGIFLLGVTVFTVGEILVAPSSDQLADESIPLKHKGRGQSIYQSTWGIGGVIAPAMAGFIVGSTPIGFGALLLAFSIVSLCCALSIRRHVVLDAMTAVTDARQ